MKKRLMLALMLALCCLVSGALGQTLPGVDAGLAASIFHFGEVRIDALKRLLRERGIPARLG